MDFGNMDRRQLTMAGAGFSVMLSLHYSFQLLSQHLFYWKNPKEQRAILVLILMPPVYAISSFFGLIDARGGESLFMLLNSVKELYGALAIATFLGLIYSYLNISMSSNVVPDEMKGKEIHHSFPITLFLPRKSHLNQQTLRLLKNWIWQFVIIRPVCSILMIALQFMGMYPSWLNWAFTITLSLSISLAMYSLVVFYRVFAEELKPHEPLSKFICIKGIVFFGFWLALLIIYGVLLDILVAKGIIEPRHFWLDTANIARPMQNILVCIEMMMFAVLHQYAYYVTPYSGGFEAKLKQQRNRD